MANPFLKVKCEKCKNEQVIFERAASAVKCLVCSELLAESSGGKIKLLTKDFVTVK